MANQYTPQVTLEYTTYLKRVVVEALTSAFKNHPDPTVAASKVALDFTHDRFKLPAVIIKYHEEQIPNIGVGHVEYLVSPTDPAPDQPTEFLKYYHRLYKGSIAFEVWGESAVDRDLLRDGLIEVLAMWDTTPAGENFLTRLYGGDPFEDDTLLADTTPYGAWHYPVLNLDLIEGSPEQVQLAPWNPEDQLVYMVTYSVPVMGEFYSVTPEFPSSTGLLQEVDVYPWIEGVDLPPDQVTSDAYYKFTGWKSTDVMFP